MHARLLRICVALLALALPTRAVPETCREILLLNEEFAGEGRVILWVSERAFSSELDPNCRDFSTVPAQIRSTLRPQPTCVAEQPEWTGSLQGVPTARRVTGAWMEKSPVILTGVVTDVEPGLSGSRGHVLTRVQARVTEVIRGALGSVAVGNQVSFLAQGGRLTIDGAEYCTDVPSAVHQWHQGDSVLLAGEAGQASDPTLILPNGMPLRIVDGRAYPPETWSPAGGSLDIDDVRSAFGGPKP